MSIASLPSAWPRWPPRATKPVPAWLSIAERIDKLRQTSPQGQPNH